jgi:asparagine synthase (glutamine-hydrolysing)
MLSGGMDSGSVVAVASELLEKEGRGPLPTFSAISSQPENCIESRTLQLSQSLAGLEPYQTNPEELRNSWSSLLSAVAHAGEPFEMEWILLWCVYQLAKGQGVNVVLDGVPGDNVLSETGYIPRLVRNGHWLTAYREIRLRNWFLKFGAPPVLQLLRAAGSAFAPEVFKVRYRQHINSIMYSRRISDRIRFSGIRADFARQVDLARRLRRMNDIPSTPIHAPLGEVTAIGMQQPFITAGIERYGRVASSLGIERRHPWMDRRLVEFSLSLPGDQRLSQGWPKAVLRRAMEGHLPDGVRYRRGKEHLGPNFSTTFLSAACPSLQQLVRGQRLHLTHFLNEDLIQKVLKLPCEERNLRNLEHFSGFVFLSLWLESRKKISIAND